MNFAALLQSITQLHDASQHAAGQSLNRIVSLRNWLIGATIIEYEQGGEDRATYGTGLIKRLATDLKAAGCKGLSGRNLKNFRQVALTWPGLEMHGILGHSHLKSAGTSIRQTSAELKRFPSLAARHKETKSLEWQDAAWIEKLFTTLTFSMLLELSREGDPEKRAFYELQCIKSGWSITDLKRQKGTLLYERIGLSRDKDAVLELVEEGRIKETPETILRDPYILEFLDLKPPPHFTESELEQALMDHLQAFLLELGSDFCFMGRQYRVTFNTNHYFIDLLFYHRTLRCLVAIDLKVEPFRHEHAGQMNFYVNYLAENVAHPDENRPIGILLCTDKDDTEVRYATGGLEQSVFVSRYLTKLPSTKVLAQWLKKERELLIAHREE